ncbi:MAG TPA: hypothetical protein VLD62_00775, partial [Acidimicrobiia bacterium]|nr:hypothetical protein [Acidimicrobiia bacterium]
AYAVRRAGLIEELEIHGHSVAFWTRTTGSGHLVRMGCKNCWRTDRGPFHRWWGLSPRRPCPNPSRPG